jgi:DNA-binding SARP family transcriptional activator
LRGGQPVTGFASAKVQALLFYLAVTARAHTREALVGLLWGDMPEADARTNLRQALSNLRKIVPAHIIIERDRVEFNRDSAYHLDVQAFERELADGRWLMDGEPSTSDHQPSAIRHLQTAVDLYRGDFLEGFSVRDAAAFEEWALAQRERLRELALGALHALTSDYLRRGQHAQGIDSARRVLALDPWREEAHRQLMLLLARSGQRSAALAQYETCRKILELYSGEKQP